MSESLRLRPGTRLLWRSGDTAQLELGSRAIVIDGLGPGAVRLLRTAGAASTAELAGPGEPAPDSGATADAGAGAGAGGGAGAVEEDLSELIGQLRHAGFVSARARRPTGAGPSTGRTTDVSPGRLAPDALSWGARLGDGAATVAAVRRAAVTVVHGDGRLPVMIASLLAAAGVGAVHLAAAGEVSVHDAAPGGLLPSDEGRRTALAGAEAVRRAAPETLTSAPVTAPHLVVVAGSGGVEAELRRFLHRERLPHLVVGVWADTATVGPLVVPGRTSCLHCADLHRADRDPAWPTLSVQVQAATRRRPRAEDVTACALAAAVAGAQALAWLEHRALPTSAPVPAAIDGTLELRVSDHRVRRRSWPRRSECACAGG